MDQYSSMGSGQPGTFGQTTAAAVARQLLRTPELRFPAEDGGQSLATWARRDLEATLQLLADRAQYITGGSGAAIALRDGDLIMCRASSGPSAPQIGSCFEISSGLSGESVRTRKTLRCDDAMSDPRVNHDSCRALGIASFAVMPLVRQDEVVGIFEIFSNQPRAFQERDLLALERMGEMVNTALDQVKHPRVMDGSASLQIDAIHMRSSVPAPSPQVTLPHPEQPESPAIELSQDHSVNDSLKLEPSPQFVPSSGSSVHVPSSPTTSSGIGTCTQCGFPVSGGRKLCLDCEAVLEIQQPTANVGAHTPAFLAGLEAEKTGWKQWIISHRYLLGTIAMSAATILVLMFR